jgi:hypothetical protein
MNELFFFATFARSFEKYAAGGVSVSSSRISRLRHSSMERWNPDRHGCPRTHPAILDAGSPCRHDEIFIFMFCKQA